jgi:hypothetical protein
MRVVGGSVARGSGAGAGSLGAMLAAFVLCAGFVAGSAGQSAVSFGAPADVSVSAAVITASRAIGGSQPARVSLQVGVINHGGAAVRVVGGTADTVTTSIRGMSPRIVRLDGGATGELTLDVALQCTWPAPLTVPALRLEQADGQERVLPLAGSAALVRACAGGTQQARPLQLVAATRAVETTAGQDRLDLQLQSPAGRTVRIRQLWAGGQLLPMIPTLPAVSSGVVTVSVHALSQCPPGWLITGIPSAVVVDLEGGGEVPLVVGRPLTDWFLHTACLVDPAR